jgi:hypothetical protein
VPEGPGNARAAAAYIRNVAAAWAKAQPATRATMNQSVHERVVVKGDEFVSIRLTPEACAHGFAIALPGEVIGPNMALARPTGVEHGDATILVRVPIARRPW